MEFRALLLVALAACGGSAAPATAHRDAPRPTPAPRPERPVDQAAADGVAAAVRAHEALVSTSVVPADSARVGEAALDALAAALAVAAPDVAWSGDAERDRALLGEAAGDLARRATRPAPSDLPLVVARAMAAAAGDPHVFALDNTGMAGLLAATSGLPHVQLGFAAHRSGDVWVVSEVFAGSAADKAGLAPGTEFAATGFDWGRDFIRHIGAREGEVIELPGGLALELARVSMPIVEHRVLPGRVGVLRVHAFTGTADAARDAGALVASALEDLDRKKVTRLVIDLRENMGGNPVPVVSILAAGDPVVWMARPGEDPQPMSRDRAFAKRKRHIAIVVNEQTYSAAEMAALALRELGGARVFGQPTAGALTVPTPAELPTGVLLFYPGALALGPRSLKSPDGRRVAPDETIPNTSGADVRAGRDAQLDAAVAWVMKQR
ncbi:MAG TPA: S41 family peptidase [Kofleriaceae bacterium]|nr:S41 family peptidase [Kofleriaceae bacterium]